MDCAATTALAVTEPPCAVPSWGLPGRARDLPEPSIARIVAALMTLNHAVRQPSPGNNR